MADSSAGSGSVPDGELLDGARVQWLLRCNNAGAGEGRHMAEREWHAVGLRSRPHYRARVRGQLLYAGRRRPYRCQPLYHLRPRPGIRAPPHSQYSNYYLIGSLTVQRKSRGAGGRRSRGAGEQGSRGAEERRSRGKSLSPLLPCSSAPLLLRFSSFSLVTFLFVDDVQERPALDEAAYVFL